jgi:uncharacterized membrane protein YbhN (UPF0104 family)
LWAAGGSFALALVCSASAWRSALSLCGGRIGRLEAGARYGVGSLVNSLLSGHAGGAVRVALFSRGLTGTERLWVASGIPAAIGAARAFLLAVLVLGAAGSGALPAWTALALAGVGCAAVAVCTWAGRRKPAHRLARVFDVFRAAGRSPSAAAPLVSWLVGAVGARVLAVAAVAAALDVRAPVAAALVIVPALALAGFASFTPAGIGVTSGAVALVLHARGVDATTALATGIALNAVETAAGLTLGIASGLLLAFPSPAARRRTLMSGVAAYASFTVVVLAIAGFADLA